MIAVVRDLKRKHHYECGTYFLVRPALSSRSSSLFAEENRSIDNVIKFIEFISSDHILTQFSKIPVLDES